MFQSKMIDITMQQIFVFLKAAEYENFSKVASELHMTQPTVSRNISAMETTLGLILFIRSKQRVRIAIVQACYLVCNLQDSRSKSQPN